jgi:type IV pilus assembly protein PilA
MLHSRRIRSEEGFTLIELMVVVLIIAILIAIAIPTFLGARRRAQDRQAQSLLRNAMTAEKSYYADEQSYTNVVASLMTAETSLDYLTTGTAEAKNRQVLVELGASGEDIVCLTTRSSSGTVFVLGDIATHANPAHVGSWHLIGALAQCSVGNLTGGSWSSW